MTSALDDPIELGRQGRWLELAALGRDAWNTWAQAHWSEPEDQRPMVDFNNQTLRRRIFDGFEFPGGASFEGTTFTEDVTFSGAKFGGSASFSSAVFLGGAYFELEPRNDEAPRFEFGDATVADTFVFRGHVSDAAFLHAHFKKRALFNRAVIEGVFYFYEVTLGDRVEFRSSEFWDAVFCGTVFPDDADFRDARFFKGANFEQARFEGLASFDGAAFEEPPILSGTTFKFPPSFLHATFEFSDSPRAYADYRRLKQLAADAHDHRSELDLFALESRARRSALVHQAASSVSRERAQKRPSRLERLLSRLARHGRLVPYWPELLFGRLYQFFSNYGRSVIRPACWLLVTALAGASAFAQLADKGWKFWSWPEAVGVAAATSLLPFAGQTFVARQVMEEGLCGPGGPGLTPGERVERLHCLTRLYQISAIEGFVAVIFLFLLVLGFRNLFRIK